MRLADLSRAVGGSILPGDVNAVFSHAVIDSRENGQGALFFALKGENRDGHEFVGQVLESGGYAVIARGNHLPGSIMVNSVEEAMLEAGEWRRGLLGCPVIGVTGSSGKTTTRELLINALRGTYKVQGTRGNLNNHLGLPLTLLNMSSDAEAAVLELGMNHSGELTVLGEIARPDISLVTNIGVAHMEFFDSRDDVARAKSELLTATVEGGTAVIPVSEPILVAAAGTRGLRVVRIGAGGDLWLGNKGNFYTAEPYGLELSLSIRGEYNRTNALFALAASTELGVPAEKALERMAAYTGMPGRGRLVNCSGVQVMDESYNANPDSTRACLQTLSETGEGRIAVLGDMRELGTVADEMHRSVLEMADSLGIRVLILTGSRFAGASSVLRATPFELADDWEEALSLLREYMKEGDTVLVKGSHSLQMNRIVTSLEEDC